MKNTTRKTNNQTKSKLARVFKPLLNLLYPQNIKCIFCGEELNDNSKYSICEFCFNSLKFIDNSCPRCSSPISDNNTGVCFNCKNNNYYFTRAFAILEYDEMMSELIHRIKYGGTKHALEPLSNFLVDKLATINENFDYITYVPMYKPRERERGYNQSKILAECVSTRVNIPLINIVEKNVDNSNQASLGYADRKENVKDVYSLVKDKRKEIKDKTILIIDDIMTTGATSNEISRLLLSAGAKECFVLVLCHGRLDSTIKDFID